MRRLFPILFFGVFFLMQNIHVLAQDYLFKEILSDRDIAGGNFQELYEDSSGFIFLGTTSGIYRTDAHNLQMIPLPDSLVTSSVSAFASLDGDKVLVGLENGVLLIYDAALDKISNFGATGSESGIRDILVTDKGVVWIASYGSGLFCLSDSIVVFHEGNGMLSDYTYCLAQDDLGRIWTGSDGGINIISTDPGQAKIEAITPSVGLPDYMVTSLHSSGSGDLLVGYESGGLGLIDPNTVIPTIGSELISLSGPVDEIVSTGEELWILAGGSCLVYRENRSPALSKISFAGIKTDPGRIKDLMLDSKGNIWIAGENALIMSSGETMTMLTATREFDYSGVQAAITDRRERLWFSIRNRLFLQDFRKGGKPQSILTSDPLSSIISIYEDINGLLWIGTFNEGLYILDPQSMKLRKLTTENGLIDNNILTITGSSSAIWFTSLGGISTLELNQDFFNKDEVPKINKFSADTVPDLNFVFDIHIARDETVWFGTDGRGIYSWSGKELTHYQHFGLDDAVILSIKEDTLGNLWFATADRGFYKFDGATFSQFTSNGGLRSANLEGMEVDMNGNLVILHRKGIDVYVPDRNTYFYLDDYTDMEFREFRFNSISSGYNGEVWISSDQGIIRYTTLSNEQFDSPKTRITSIEVMNEKIDQKSLQNFAHSRNHFSFQITSIWYTAPGRIRYRYKLESLEQEWIETRSSQVSYSALSPGIYTFSVQSSYYDDFTNADTAEYSFIIQKPFWRRIWFLTLVSGVLITMLIIIIRKREENYRNREMQARKQLSLQLESLQNQVNPHFLFNSFNTLVSMIDEDKGIAIEYVEHLSDFFRNVLIYSNRELIPLREELDLLRSYTYLQKKRYGESLQLEIELPDKVLDSLIPPLSLQILVENAVKHNVVSEKKSLLVKIYDQERGITVENNLQPKKNVEPSTKTGLENIVRRYEMLGTKPVHVESKNNSFIVILPYLSDRD